MGPMLGSWRRGLVGIAYGSTHPTNTPDQTFHRRVGGAQRYPRGNAMGPMLGSWRRGLAGIAYRLHPPYKYLRPNHPP
ncbi:hypothetical protein VK98_08640 [Chromobacterium sp. LK11]|nr:hypothetical protein VK98_08640 [Chromobacterium sp. LK11]